MRCFHRKSLIKGMSDSPIVQADLASEMLIRHATRQDVRAIAEINAVALAGSYKGFVPDAYLDALSVSGYVRRWERALERQVGRSAVHVAEEDGEVTGFSAFAPTLDPDQDSKTCAELHSIFVRPESWGMGVGKLLLRSSLEEMKALGYERASLAVLVQNERARHLYESVGFHPDRSSVEELREGDQVCQIEMIRYLADLS